MSLILQTANKGWDKNFERKQNYLSNVSQGKFSIMHIFTALIPSVNQSCHLVIYSNGWKTALICIVFCQFSGKLVKISAIFGWKLSCTHYIVPEFTFSQKYCFHSLIISHCFHFAVFFYHCSATITETQYFLHMFQIKSAVFH